MKNPTSRCVAESATNEKGEANARLIAAAPELLELCRDSVGVLEQAAHVIDDSDNATAANLFMIVDRMESTIAKAERGTE